MESLIDSKFFTFFLIKSKIINHNILLIFRLIRSCIIINIIIR